MKTASIAQAAKAASPNNCATGSWTQKFQCGWAQPTTGAAHLGHATGSVLMPAVITVAVIFLLFMFLSSRRKPAAQS